MDERLQPWGYPQWQPHASLETRAGKKPSGRPRLLEDWAAKWAGPGWAGLGWAGLGLAEQGWAGLGFKPRISGLASAHLLPTGACV